MVVNIPDYFHHVVLVVYLRLSSSLVCFYAVGSERFQSGRAYSHTTLLISLFPF